MHVWHGDYNKTEIINGSTFEECLAYLSHTPMYKGYGPLDNPKLKDLKEKGKLSAGWADYNFYNDEQIADLLK